MQHVSYYHVDFDLLLPFIDIFQGQIIFALLKELSTFALFHFVIIFEGHILATIFFHHLSVMIPVFSDFHHFVWESPFKSFCYLRAMSFFCLLTLF
jgi:hypothetical protein